MRRQLNFKEIVAKTMASLSHSLTNLNFRLDDSIFREQSKIFCRNLNCDQRSVSLINPGQNVLAAYSGDDPL